MMEERKPGKALKVLSILLFILLIVAVVFVVLGFMKSNETKKEIDSLKEKNEQLEKELKNENGNVEGLYLDYVDAGEETKIYSVYDHIIVFSVKNELYLADYFSDLFFSDSIYAVKNLKFENNYARVNVANHEAIVYRLGIKTDNVYKVVARHCANYNDPTGEIYVIYKDNGLTYFTESDLERNYSAMKILTDYKKIVKVDPICKSGEFGCEKVTYKVTTSDGKTTILDNLK